MKAMRFDCPNCRFAFDVSSRTSATNTPSEVPEARLIEAKCPACDYTVRKIIRRDRLDVARRLYFQMRRQNKFPHDNAWYIARKEAGL